jgi:hypothetical protein
MRWPPDLPAPVRRRILGLWSSANDATSLNERTKALAALKQLQLDHGLTDVELSYIAECEQKEPSKLDGVPDERLINVFELIIHLIRLNHIILGFEPAVTVALWILHTHVYDLFLHTPRLILRSFEPGCGKTVLLSLIGLLADQGYLIGHTTPAAIYRRLKRRRTTFLLDEAEHSPLWSSRLFKALFDMGHRQGRSVSLTDVITGEEVEYPAYFPLALALVEERRLAPQLLDRSIIIEMEKHPEGRDAVGVNDHRFTTVHRFICEWASTFRRSPLAGC